MAKRFKPLTSLWKRARRPFLRADAFKRLREYHAEARSIEDLTHWAMNFGGRGEFAIRTKQIPWEITELAKFVGESKPRIILEIGTARAGTLLIWAALASERVISCDLGDMKVRSDLYKALPPPGSACRVTLLSGDSHNPGFRQRVASELNGEQVDFLFIDGDHTVEGVTADYEHYKNFVRPGGFIAFHDIVETQPIPTNQVYHLWKTLRNRQDTREFVANPNQCGFGIGVVRIPMA